MTRLTKWLPKGFGARVGVILIGVILTVQLAALGVFLWREADAGSRLFQFSSGHRMAAALRLIEASPPLERRLAVLAVNSPTLGVSIYSDPPFESSEQGDFSRRVLRAIGRQQSPFRGREIRIRLNDEERGPERLRLLRKTRGLEPGEAPDLLPSRRKLEIATRLDDGQWLVFRIPAEATSLRWAAQLVLWIGVSFAALSLLAFLAIRRMARPLRELATHAERLGTNLETPPMKEGGPSEVVAAAHAFNLMQSRLKRYLDDRTRMLAALSHDLRTMITRLKLRAEFIDDRDQQAKAIRDLDDMQTMLETSLTFARDEARSEALAATDIAALVRAALDDLNDQGHVTDYSGPEHLVHACRPVALRRALDNLLLNAVTYGGNAEVQLRKREGDIILEIADRGPGIPKSERDKVFDPFYRLESSRSRETGGTGLGLSVAQSIVRSHGGEITLDERTGGGLLARVTLPVVG